MKKLLLSVAVIATSFMSYAQVNIGGTEVGPSILLQLDGVSKGLIVPRLTDAQRAEMKSPKAGILIYNTDAGSFQVSNNAGAWFNISDSSTFAAGTGENSNTSKVAIGTTDPDLNTALDLVSTTTPRKGVRVNRTIEEPPVVEGMIYFNLDTRKLRGSNGMEWFDLIN
jgi:hypothetical protein